MIHLLCECGALVSLVPPAGARSVSCKACSRVLPVPDPAEVGLVPAAAGGGAPASFPGVGLPPGGRQVPGAPAEPPPRHGAPVFESDERLNLPVLEREAARQGALGSLVLAGGIVGAGATLVLLDAGLAARGAAAAAILFLALAGWSGLRAARASCLASVALAQRQKEIVRGMERR